MNTIDDLLACICDPTRPLEARIAAAERLAAEGDPRLPSDWVDIEPGHLHHKPSRDADVQLIAVGGLSMARYPVTVGEYAEFVDGGMYDDPSCWSAEGWRWRIDEDIEAPRFWDEPEWAPYLIANHPVVGVSWYEADAYATYRDARLPTELEWERGCRGDDARDYPWGDEWLDGACGQRDHGPRATTPVGVYPIGVSPAGLCDMVGNVWQWTADSGGSGARAPRLACGGAWNNLPWSIGAAGRNAFPARARFSNLGLRLVR